MFLNNISNLFFQLTVKYIPQCSVVKYSKATIVIQVINLHLPDKEEEL